MTYHEPDAREAGTLQELPLTLIDPSPFQARLKFDEVALEELAASIQQHGVIQPLIVRQTGERYQLIAGERRLRAAQKTSLKAVPAIIRKCTDEEALEAGLIENIQREDISIVETAKAYQRLTEEFHYSQGEVALRTGKSRATISNTLRLLHLPSAVLSLLDTGEIMEGHARALLPLAYPSLQTELAEWAARNAAPVRDVEKRVKQLLAGDEPGTSSPASVPRDPQAAHLEERLRHRFQTKAALTYQAGRGSLTLEFYSDDDLERILELLGL